MPPRPSGTFSFFSCLGRSMPPRPAGAGAAPSSDLLLGRGGGPARRRTKATVGRASGGGRHGERVTIFTRSSATWRDSTRWGNATGAAPVGGLDVAARGFVQKCFGGLIHGVVSTRGSRATREARSGEPRRSDARHRRAGGNPNFSRGLHCANETRSHPESAARWRVRSVQRPASPTTSMNTSPRANVPLLRTPSV